MISKRVKTVPFICGSQACPKRQDEYNRYKFNKVYPPIKDNFRTRGCPFLATTVWYLATGHLSEDEIEQLPLIAVVLPSPDPTGAQGMGGGVGVGRDIIFEQLFKANGQQPVRVALMYLVRGFNFHRAIRSELVQSGLSQAPISYCSPYLVGDLQTLKPVRIVACGQEVVSFLYENDSAELATVRREYGHTFKTPDGTVIPMQATFNPYTASIFPVYIKTIFEDCQKLFKEEPVAAPTTYRIIRELDEAKEYIQFLREYTGYISVDTETQNLNRKATNKMATLQFATNNTKGVVIPYQHWETPFSPDELAELKTEFTDLFSRPIASKGWISHNAKFENMIFDMHFGVMMDSAPIYCTQAMSFLLDETRSERKMDKPRNGGIYTLKQLAWDLLNFQGYDKGILRIRQEGALFDLPLEELGEYGAMDAAITHRLFFRILELAKEDNYDETILKFTGLFYSGLTRLIAHIERTGFKTDIRKLRELSSKAGPFERRLHDVTDKLRNTEAFHEANKLLVKDKNVGRTTGVLGDVPWVLDFDKPDHQALVFFKTMDLEPVSFSDKTGRPAIDDGFFEAYCSDDAKGKVGHLEVDLFYKYKETKQMRDVFITKLVERIDPETGDPDSRIDQRIRPDIHYARLVTGRLAMVNPNMGQIPKAEENPDPNEFAVRKAVKDNFTVDRGGALLQVDYKVNEVRWAAILAKDPAMAQIFNDAAARIREAVASKNLDSIKQALFLEDIHRNTAAAAFNVPISEVTKKQRQAAKAITFGILFQQSAEALAAGIGATEEQAIEFQRIFFSKMTGVAAMIDNLKNQARTKGYVEAPHGRRRRFWAFHLPDDFPYKRKQENRNLRQAVNSPIQGIASDAAMYGGAYSLFEYIRKNKRNWLIQNVVHDSCLIQITDAEETAEAIEIMEPLFVDEAQRKMEEMGVVFNLPLGIDVEAGITWGSLEKWIGTPEHALELQQMVQKAWLVN